MLPDTDDYRDAEVCHTDSCEHVAQARAARRLAEQVEYLRTLARPVCSNCGHAWTVWSCGMGHAMARNALGIEWDGITPGLAQPEGTDCIRCGRPMSEHHGGEDPDVPAIRRECPEGTATGGEE